MNTIKENSELFWTSIILRVAMSSLFFVAAVNKFVMGLENSAGYIIGMFSKTWLPAFVVVPYAYALAFVEIIIAIWLFSGQKLKIAWVFTAFILITLAFGMAVAQQYAIAASNYVYVVMACAGLYVSRYDHCDCCRKRK